ncbi:hypothetical protein M8J73_41120, partial [Streptomyces neyagawaensis]|nr:hypothetical protein [Streptomyces neyagawaensis]
MNDVDRDGEAAQEPPNVYHPLGDPSTVPAYDGLPDPAAAHGWQNAYDDTVQLDELVLDDLRGTPDGTGTPPAMGAAGAAAPTGPADGSYGADAHGHADPYAPDGSYPLGGVDPGGRRARPSGGRRATLGRRRARR